MRKLDVEVKGIRKLDVEVKAIRKNTGSLRQDIGKLSKDVTDGEKKMETKMKKLIIGDVSIHGEINALKSNMVTVESRLVQKGKFQISIGRDILKEA